MSFKCSVCKVAHYQKPVKVTTVLRNVIYSYDNSYENSKSFQGTEIIREVDVCEAKKSMLGTPAVKPEVKTVHCKMQEKKLPEDQKNRWRNAEPVIE